MLPYPKRGDTLEGIVVAVAVAAVVVWGGATQVPVALVVQVVMLAGGATQAPLAEVVLPHGELPQVPMVQIQLHGELQDGQVQVRKLILGGIFNSYGYFTVEKYLTVNEKNKLTYI